jgi:glycerol-3-phosphate acyltransferase PlsY
MSSLNFIDYFILGSAYMLGSLPFGLLFSWLFKLEDPRTVGSKNIGATNILRSGHRGAAILTLLFDALKGSMAVGLVLGLTPSLAPWAGIFCVGGHIWPLWLRFRGGKGVATAFGVILILSWPLALLCFLTWIGVAICTRYSSLGSLLSVALSPLYSLFLKREDLTMTCLILGLLIIWSHRQNIGRLLTGRETQIGNTRTPPPSHT